MKILVLSRSKFLFTTKRLVQESIIRKHSCLVLDPTECNIIIQDGKSIVKVAAEEIDNFDVIIPRIGVTTSEYSITILKQFENHNCITLNRSESIELAKDKFRSLQKLNNEGISIPPTMKIRAKENIDELIDMLGGLPIIFKTIQGSQGAGVALVESIPGLNSLLDTFSVIGQSPLIQKYYPETEGCDIRVIVIGGRAIASMHRHSAKDDFRSNIHRGGFGEVAQDTEKYDELAVKCAKILKLDIAGVDLVTTNEGIKVLEVNATPGFEEIEKVSKKNIAKLVIELAEQKLQTIYRNDSSEPTELINIL